MPERSRRLYASCVESSSGSSERQTAIISFLAAVLGAGLVVLGQIATDRLTADETASREEVAFLRQERVTAYGEFSAAFYSTQVALDALAGSMLESADDRELFLDDVARSNDALAALAERLGAISVVGSHEVIDDAVAANAAMRKLFSAMSNRYFDHATDPQQDRFNRGLAWQDHLDCVGDAHFAVFSASARVDLGASNETVLALASCPGAIE